MTDRIEKTTLIRAPIEKVWRAVSDHREFGTWFKVDLDGPFVAGQLSTGKMTYPGFEGYPWLAWVTVVDEPRLLAFEWTPGSEVPDDPDSAPRTLVEFRLASEGNATRLHIVESGFDSLPESLRESALRSNTEGWDIQIDNLQHHAEG
ncbi:MAG: SRPBCC family protein [Sphingomicrobium sp.]